MSVDTTRPTIENSEPPTIGPAGPLSPDHQLAISQADRRARKIVASGKVACFNGYLTGTFAALSLVFGFSSPTGLLMGAGLGVVSWNEFRGRKLVLAFEPHGARVLGWNQVGFIGLLVVYSLWNIFAAFTQANPYETYIHDMPELAGALGPIADLHVTLTVVVYGSVIVGTAIAQGLNARYYFRRVGMIEGHLEQTPPWIVRLQRRSLG